MCNCTTYPAERLLRKYRSSCVGGALYGSEFKAHGKKDLDFSVTPVRSSVEDCSEKFAARSEELNLLAPTKPIL